MQEIDVSINMADVTPHYWDGYWDNAMGKSSKDPDSKCALLQDYHSKLWSKRLPNGAILDLNKGYGKDYLTWNNFRFGSDSIIVSFRYEKYKEMIYSVMKTVPDYKDFIESYLKISNTIGGFIIFPKRKGGINQTRGCNDQIKDRFDLTLECIRKYYIGEKSPLSTVLEQDKDFFNLFLDFRGYIEFFFLQDLVSSDYTKINFWLGEGDMNQSPFPKTVDEYLDFIEKELDFVQKRNNRIRQSIL